MLRDFAVFHIRGYFAEALRSSVTSTRVSVCLNTSLKAIVNAENSSADTFAHNFIYRHSIIFICKFILLLFQILRDWGIVYFQLSTNNDQNFLCILDTPENFSTYNLRVII